MSRASSASVLFRILLATVLVIAVCTGVVAVRVSPHLVSSLFERATRIEQGLGPAGWLLAALIQVVIALCGVLPASIGGLAAGLVYGIVGGFLVSAFGTLVGAALAFLLARSLFRPLIVRMLWRRPRFARLDEAVARDGWRLVCLLRISPVMPFAMTSYALGLTSLDLRSYAIGTLASLPALFGYVVLGALSSRGLGALASHEAQPLHWVLLVLAIVATLLLILKLGSVVRYVIRLPEAS